MTRDAMTISRRSLIAAAAAMAVPFQRASAQSPPRPLVNPYDAAALRSRKGTRVKTILACPIMMPPARDLTVPGFYIDPPVYSRVDPEKWAQRQAAIKPINDVVRGVTQSVDRWSRSNPAEPSYAACAAAALDGMAQAGSAVGRVDQQGEYERKWMFTALALAHLKLVQAAEYDAATQKRVRDWFASYLPLLRAAYSKTPGRSSAPSSQLNNHATWAGLCAMALALAIGDHATWNWGLEKMRLTLGQVDAEGFLPQEVKRGSKALHYHCFTLGPLALAAFLARANGTDLVGAENDPFQRLVRCVLAGYANPATFELRSGQKQEGNSAGRFDVSWVEIYAGAFDQPAILPVLGGRRPQVMPWLGGDLTLWHARG